MILEHRGFRPTISATAHIAPNATIVGDVSIGDNCAIGFGAVLTAESGPIRIGSNVVVMDTAVLHGVKNAPLTIGSNVLVGPRAYLTGCTVEDEVFIATGATVFNKAVLKARSEVRINAIVHLRTVLPEDAVVPLGWIAVGDPAKILPPEQHDEIWAIQKTLDFPKTVFGVDRPPEGQSMMRDVMPRYARALTHWHESDREIDD
ncbi:gamma carbonic anhydrase family protein [Rhizomicrobium electricum]|uniref:Gamma carbonic anhydrase family protein n=1 Tax=Rhizomicrobium electricum TaxID=480070 RepID=A0ABN1F5M8_9PROT|nr:gamma carbonic anhydrase family protein [Rhizomicrobium electricum]NIJ50505.1 carbonic anhydrase/acetyltransferase-like protein (isoleucine patch superfamily) [Rhizomicrobium electricum]